MVVQWEPLESNPDSFNAFIEKLGIKGGTFVDVLGFDDELIEMIPRPHYALILCYPDYKTVDKIMRPVYDKLKDDGAKVPDNMFFMKQKISNACGTFALFHALAQNEKNLDFGQGPFKSWFEDAKKLSVEERSDSLANSSSLSSAHDSVAKGGETQSDPDTVEHHFITYLNLDGTLYEFDSRMQFPRACGTTSSETFIKDAGKHCTSLSEKLEGNISFSAIALVGEQ